MVFRLRHSFYGLKETPHAWFERLSSVITVSSFSPNNAHNLSIFVYMSSHGRTLLLLYVDDMLIIGDDTHYIAIVKEKLGTQFLMNVLGPLHYFLEIEVSSTSEGFLYPKRSVSDICLIVPLLPISVLPIL
ncbi:unnamed protein product [Rhodiola kirilowii]